MDILAEATEKALIIAGSVDSDLIAALEAVNDRTDQEQRILDVARAQGAFPLVNIRQMILAGGRDPLFPVLAFASAGATICECCDYGEGTVIASDAYGVKTRLRIPEWKLTWFLKGPVSATVQVPLVPPEIRPTSLREYYIVWEADWERVPRTHDPLLLRRVDRDIYGIVATWDMTERELAAMRLARI